MARPCRLDYEQVSTWLEDNEFQWVDGAELFKTTTHWLREVYRKHRGEARYLEAKVFGPSIMSKDDIAVAMRLVDTGVSGYLIAQHLTGTTGKSITRSAVVSAIRRHLQKLDYEPQPPVVATNNPNLPPLPPSMTNPDWGLHRFDPIIRQRLALESPQ